MNDKIVRRRDKAYPVHFSKSKLAKILKRPDGYIIEIKRRNDVIWQRVGSLYPEKDFLDLVKAFDFCSVQEYWTNNKLNKFNKLATFFSPDVSSLYVLWRSFYRSKSKVFEEKEQNIVRVPADFDREVDYSYWHTGYGFDLSVEPRRPRDPHEGNIRSVREARRFNRMR